MRRILSLFSLLAAISGLLPQPAQAEDLALFKRYFGTIDYSVTGTGGIRGTGKLDPLTNEYLAEKTIGVDFPPAADLEAAFLYWQTVEKTSLPSSARGWLSYPTNPNARIKILGKPLGDKTAPCWSNGGSTGSANGAPTLRVYRADVLRYLKAPGASAVSPQITVRLRDSGSNGNKVPLTEGASLVLIYRHPSIPFKSVVLIDGSQTMDNSADIMSLTIKGFDQASRGSAKITHIVGNGQPNFSERLFFNNTLLETNPFKSGWDDKTYDVSSLVIPPSTPPNQIISTATTKVDHLGHPFDCLSWGAVVFSTTVQDTDEDGLLDVWETDGYKDLATGQVLVDLPRMGANPRKKDLFVEVDYMVEQANDALGTPHSHLPSLQALEMVGDAFARAPVNNPNGSMGINVFFDVGNNYQGNPYILRGGALKGGDKLDERSAATFCTQFTPASPGVPAGCLFPNQPGLISWKKGIQHIRNNYFSDDRENIFHYLFFGHGLAIKGPELPRGSHGELQGYSAKSVSGRADLPGNTVTVTLGRWRSSPPDTNVGSPNLQAATLLHELSHNLWGFHGGTTLDGPFTINDAIVSRANCNPNRQSSLNYLYQSAGLLDRQGVFRVNLSGEILTAPTGAQDEAGLQENAGLGAGDTAYRLRWYAPLANVLSSFQRRANGTLVPLPAALAHCDGLTPIGISETPVIRVDGEGVPGDPLARMPVDWDYDKTIRFLSGFVDINFNGHQDRTEDFRGFDDWKSLVNLHGLQQVGSGRNVFSLSLGVTSADLLRAGEDDLGEDDLGEDDLGETQIGQVQTTGEDDLGEDDLGEDDLGEDDLGQVSEIDEATAIAIGGSGPTALAASVPTGAPRILLNWSSPAFGGVVQRYLIFRVSGEGSGFAEIGQSLTTTFTDTNTRSGTRYTYLVIAVFAGGESGTLSTPSNGVTITQ